MTALRIDRDGTLWVGGWQGLSRRARGATGFEKVVLPPPTRGAAAGARNDTVTALLQAANGALWVGTQQGRMLIVDPSTLQVRDVGVPGGPITSLAEAAGSTVWVGRRSGIDLHRVGDGRWQRTLTHDPRRYHGLAGNEVAALLTDRAGSMWVAGFGLGLQRHEPGNLAIRMRGADLQPGSPFATADVRALMQRRNGEVWAALQPGGVVVMNAGLQVTGSAGAREGDVAPPRVTALHEAADGSVWMGSEGQVHQLDAQRRLLRRLPHGGGRTHFLLPAVDGTLWVGAQDGVFYLAPGAAALRQAPLPAGRRTLGEVFVGTRSGDGGLWMGGVQGLFRIAPGGRDLQVIDSDDGGAGLANPIVVGLLVDRDDTLRVRATNRSGVWSAQELVLPLQVLPAWWQLPLARAIAAVLALLALLGLIEWRTRHLRRQRSALAQAVAERTTELEAERAALDERVQTRTHELSAATAAAEAANQAKGVFLNNVSHEMRTPLNAIIGLTQLQQQVAADDTQRGRLAQVGSAARQLLGLVDHVLELSNRSPAAPTPLPAASPPEVGVAMPSFHGERVLLAEDEAVNQIVATGILENAGLQVDLAENGAQAVRMAAATDYALILMDIRMPELDGLAATRAIRATPAGREVPIVAFSAFAFDQDRRHCLEAGMNAHVSKPVDTAVLLHAVRRWLRRPAD